MTGNDVLEFALKYSEHERPDIRHERPDIRAAIDDFAERNHFPEEETYKLQLCLEEAILNIVKYGFHDADKHSIDIVLEFRGYTRSLAIRILDDGAMFDSFGESDLHDFDSHLQSQSSGVLGLYLVRKYADTACYRRQGDRNHLVLSKIISRKPS